MVALVLGILALLVPVAGMALGVLAALVAAPVRRRGTPPRAVKLASLGTFLGLIAILLNLVIGVIWVVISALRGAG
jgi:hypothetical protein